MAIQSLGVGSGLALDDLVTQLLEAERGPKQQRLDDRDEELDAVISGVGQLKSKLDDFKDAVDELRSSHELQGREAVVSHPSEATDSEGENGPFTAEASSSATAGEYQVAVTQLASGSRIETTDNDFATSSTSVNTDTVAHDLEFKIGATKSFTISVTAGMTLTQLRAAVNDASDNFGVNASIIDTGTVGAKLVFTSDTTGAGNDLVIVNKDDFADLNKISTTDAAETGTNLTAVLNAQNALARIDGIDVSSTTNEFENVIENVSFEVTKLSTILNNGDGDDSTLADNTYDNSTLKIGHDTQGVKTKINDFVDNYNSLITEITTLTRYGLSELEDDGALAGDFMARGIQSGLANILSSAVSTSSLGSLFQIGVSFDDKGKLQISSTDDFGLGSGQEMLDEALEDNYDEIASLFSDDNEGIAVRLYDFIYEYTTFGGLLRNREDALKSQKDSIADERETFELQMVNFESLLRKKYTSLDLTVAKLNQTGSALFAALGTTQ